MSLIAASSDGAGLSKYSLTEFANGFAIEGPDRPRVRVECSARSFEVVAPNSLDDRRRCFGLFEFYRLNAAVAEGLMRGWTPPQRHQRPWSHVRRWAVTQTERAINHRIHAQWQRLLKTVDPTVVAVQRAIFAATLSSAPVATRPELYHRSYLVRDIVSYRAAAIATLHIEVLSREARERKVATSPSAVSLRAFAKKLGLRVDINAMPIRGWSPFNDRDDSLLGDEHTGSLLDDLEDWRGLFSPTGRSYRSLNRTLMRLPGVVPHGLVCAQGELRLGRPLVTRAEVIVAGLFVVRARGHKRKAGVFASARVPQIREALRRVAAHTRNDLSFRRTRDLRFLVNFLLDYPEDHHGTLVGLADKAIRWHQHELAHERSRLLTQYGAATGLAAPPLPPPADPSIRLLATVDDVAEEGERMGHCIASHIPGAVEGYCYLFHVDYRNEAAAVMVDSRGRVAQAEGPRNRRNRASAWGTRVLRAWGRAWPAEQPPLQRGNRPVEQAIDSALVEI